MFGNCNKYHGVCNFLYLFTNFIYSHIQLKELIHLTFTTKPNQDKRSELIRDYVVLKNS